MLLFICYSSDFSAYAGVLVLYCVFITAGFGIQDNIKSYLIHCSKNERSFLYAAAIT